MGNAARTKQTNEENKATIAKPTQAQAQIQKIPEMKTQAMDLVLLNAFLLEFFLQTVDKFFVRFVGCLHFSAALISMFFHLIRCGFCFRAFGHNFLMIRKCRPRSMDFTQLRILSYLPFVTFAHFSRSLFRFDFYNIQAFILVRLSHLHTFILYSQLHWNYERVNTARFNTIRKFDRIDYLHQLHIWIIYEQYNNRRTKLHRTLLRTYCLNFWKLKNANLITRWLAHFNDILLQFQIKSDYSNESRFHSDFSCKKNNCKNISLYGRAHPNTFRFDVRGWAFIQVASNEKKNFSMAINSSL